MAVEAVAVADFVPLQDLLLPQEAHIQSPLAQAALVKQQRLAKAEVIPYLARLLLLAEAAAHIETLAHLAKAVGLVAADVVKVFRAMGVI